MKTAELDINFCDLTSEAQTAVLKFYGIEKPEDLNLDVVPLMTITKETDEDVAGLLECLKNNIEVIESKEFDENKINESRFYNLNCKDYKINIEDNCLLINYTTYSWNSDSITDFVKEVKRCIDVLCTKFYTRYPEVKPESIVVKLSLKDVYNYHQYITTLILKKEINICK